MNFTIQEKKREKKVYYNTDFIFVALDDPAVLITLAFHHSNLGKLFKVATSMGDNTSRKV